MAGPGNFQDIDITTCDVNGVREVRGCTDAAGLRFGIVVSRFNRRLTEPLVKNAIDALIMHGATAEHIQVVWVPGAFEVPLVLEKLATAGRHRALIGLGAVIQGETPHAQAIGHTVASAISDISRRYGVPIIDGIVVAPTLELAEARCLSGSDSRGTYAALAAVEMAHVINNLPKLEDDA